MSYLFDEVSFPFLLLKLTLTPFIKVMDIFTLFLFENKMQNNNEEKNLISE